MRNISYGDVIRTLRNKRIASGIAGVGVGAAGGFLLGDQTNWYNPWKGALAGAAIGALLGADGSFLGTGIGAGAGYGGYLYGKRNWILPG